MVQGTISVIIPSYNAADTLVRCLRAVTGQDDADFEVIVVDDGSTDATSAILSKFDVVQLKNPAQVGPAISRNRGADAATGAYLVFTDADCVPPSHWLSDIRKWLEVAPVVAGTYLPAPWQGPLGRFANLDWYLYWFRHIPAETDSFSMGNVAFHREVYFDRDRLEEHFFHRLAAAEDTIVAMTIAEQYRILSTEQLWVLHMHREHLGAYIRKHITTGFSRTLLSLAFPQRKIFAARDIRLSFVFLQLLTTLLLTVGLVGLPFNLTPWLAIVSGGAFLATQASSLLVISRKEPSPLFWLMSLGLFYVRNLSWLMGLAKALIYVVQSPPELEAAERWRAQQDVEPAEFDVKEAQMADPTAQIERAKAESAH
jgi:glycosyltransferase involved in cell wall biosynthesis